MVQNGLRQKWSKGIEWILGEEVILYRVIGKGLTVK